MTLHPLLLAGPKEAALAQATALALGTRHRPTILVKGGLFPGLDSARAAHDTHPELIHAFGFDGAAQAAPKVAAGLGLPLLVTVGQDGLTEDLSRRELAVLAAAKAVILTSGQDAARLRAQGVSRELYVIAAPGPEELLIYFGALEVVYGRALAGEALEYDEPEAPATPGLVQLGGRRKSPTE